MKRTIFCFIFVLVALSSCYKLLHTYAPAEVEAGQTFEARMVVVDDGSSTQNFVTDWSVAAIRVPKGWTVSVPKGGHEQFAEEWVYYSDGSKVHSKHDMSFNQHMTDLCNQLNSRAGYEWQGFVSTKKVPKNISACWRNGCDSIAITFQVTVPADCKPGTYILDFIGGDEEDEAGVTKYAALSDAKSSRLFHTATVKSSYVEHVATHLTRRVVVKEPTAIQNVLDKSSHSPGVYDADGRLIRRTNDLHGLPPGLYILSGRKHLVK